MEIQNIRPNVDRNHFFTLSFLLVLFCLRVSGQLLVALYQVPFLPPMQEWQSGLLPYPVLVTCQFLIIALFAKVCCDFYNQHGFFYEPKTALAAPLINFGKAYFVLNSARFLIWTVVLNHVGLTGTIPIIFHFVLASFLILVAAHHRTELARIVVGKPLQSLSERQKVRL
ncbi:hypothetical protein BH10CYA1_BH10CYA1_03000 [soil metagenome]